MTAVGTPKTIVFAIGQIPKDNPSSVALKDSFVVGEKIWMRAFFEKTFGEYVKEEQARTYNVRVYPEGEMYKYIGSYVVQIGSDMHSWKGFQNELCQSGVKSALERLPQGKHKLRVVVVLGIPNPNKQYQVTTDGIRDASGNMEGSIVAEGEITVENNTPLPEVPGIPKEELAKLPQKVQDMVYGLMHKDLQAVLASIDGLKQLMQDDPQTFQYLSSYLALFMFEKGPTNNILYTGITQLLSQANGRDGFDMSWAAGVLIYCLGLQDSNQRVMAGNLIQAILARHPEAKERIKTGIAQSGLITTEPNVQEVLAACE